MNIWYTSIFYILYIYIVLAILNIRAKHYEIYIPKCIYLYLFILFIYLFKSDMKYRGP